MDATGMMAQRATSEGIPGIPDGTPGKVWTAGGYFDPESCEYEAWLFFPENDPEEAGYYCERTQWVAA